METKHVINAGTLKVPEGGGTFAAKDFFKKDNNALCMIGNGFVTHFLEFFGKIETLVSPQETQYMYTFPDLFEGAVRFSDGEIIQALGGADKVETTLQEFAKMLKEQPNGEDGSLLTNGRANIRYVKDIYRTLCVVSGIWSQKDHGWKVNATACGVKYWYPGDRVFSRSPQKT